MIYTYPICKNTFTGVKESASESVSLHVRVSVRPAIHQLDVHLLDLCESEIEIPFRRFVLLFLGRQFLLQLILGFLQFGAERFELLRFLLEPLKLWSSHESLILA